MKDIARTATNCEMDSGILKFELKIRVSCQKIPSSTEFHKNRADLIRDSKLGHSRHLGFLNYETSSFLSKNPSYLPIHNKHIKKL